MRCSAVYGVLVKGQRVKTCGDETYPGGMTQPSIVRGRIRPAYEQIRDWSCTTSQSHSLTRRRRGRGHPPGCPYLRTAEPGGAGTRAVDIFASPFWSRSMMGGGRGMGLRDEMAVATPPPTTAPTAKQATCTKDVLGIDRTSHPMNILHHSRVSRHTVTA